MKKSYLPLLLLAGAALSASAQRPGLAPNPEPNVTEKYVHHNAANPYLPLWEHVPDGEPRVFEDPDNPGKYRIYIIGSHDVRFDSYCGPDIRMWSAPVEDLQSWRDEGPIFTFPIDGQWDVMYAPDLVEVRRKDGSKEYYLYPHSRGWGREAMVTKSSRPDGPFEPINLDPATNRAVEGSVLGFDPSIYIEYVTDPNDPDYEIGFRAYGYWGFQRSSAAQLDQNTMYSVRPGTELIPYFMPAGTPDGGVREPEGTEYPCLFPGEKPGSYNFFEASSIRKIGNKYVTIYSGYSGPEYGLYNSNSTLRYAYADSPLGPWKSGGVLVDSRGPVPSLDGSEMISTQGNHNTHGSVEQINGQWYVFYHRPPRNFGGARQAVVAPIHVDVDSKPVAKGGKVVIRAFDPYARKGFTTVKDKAGHEYTGAEVTSEGFNVFGLDPYKYYTAGIACYLSDTGLQQDGFDIWNDHAGVGTLKNGNIVGYKYFGFGGLDKDQLGLKAFAGTKDGNNTKFNLFIDPKTDKAFKINVWLDGPVANDVWKGIMLGTIEVPAGAKAGRYVLDVPAVDKLDKKHAIYLVAEGPDGVGLCDLVGLGFSSDQQQIDQPAVPEVTISINGEKLDLPSTPARSTNLNGYADLSTYEMTYNTPLPLRGLRLDAGSTDPEVKTYIHRIDVDGRKATVKFEYRGKVKTYIIHL